MKENGLGARIYSLVKPFFWVLAVCSLLACFVWLYFDRSDELHLAPILAAAGLIFGIIASFLRDPAGDLRLVIGRASTGAVLYSVLLVGSGLALLIVGALFDANSATQIALIIFPIDVALGIFGAILQNRLRRARAALILEYIDEAVRMNLPLAPMIKAAADSERGMTHLRLMELHDRLEQGEPLADAIGHSVPEVGATAVRAIRAASEIGRLPQLLRRMVNRQAPPDPSVADLDGFYRGYALLVLFSLVAGIGTLLCIVVMPKFISIMVSMKAPLPYSTQLLMAFYNSYIPFVLLGLMLLLACIPATGNLRDYLLWFVPVAGPTARDQAMADMCGFMVDALEVGRPMDAALAGAAEAQPNAIVRKRIGRWTALIAAGQSMSDAAREARMPEVLVGMLKTVRDTDGMIQVLTFLARHFESRFTRLREFARAAMVPGLVAVMGVAVMLVCLSVFQPMVMMININAARDYGGF